ncbi:aminodeoxychorismate synthase component I [Kiloniella laminariae]|uniref:Probable branched-chain-amino-acid aminotransferase n=1 Tax=Kiloniella laminariae TaxID=454162 RepID=A0ABT4LKX8_9PROT|nr:aminodeoxychorismate synthase component I [Kiloniella laminariae]MCZ4281769.1 aminodeoxychorismate synthase component I [Kiloniella laminariae]
MEKQTDPFVLLDDTLSGAGSVLFIKPEAVIQCTEATTLEMCFSDMEKAQKAGKHLAGYLSYELGYHFEPRLQGLLKQLTPDTPLLWFGVFDQALLLTPEETNRFLARQRWGDYQLDNLTPSMTEADYCRAVEKVRDYIAAGDTYQVNYTFKHDFELSGDPVGLFQELRQRQNVANGAFIRTEDQTFLSLSPEIFLSTEGRKARTRPMKGTAARGNTPAVDVENKIWLTRDEKSRAENLMIVDLLRNDMGRVCTTGSIKVTELFTVETYRSLHQMTSNITGELRPEITSTDLIKRLFPCGSITGAPKLRTMEIIHELEARPRGIYTGSIGHIAPNGDTRFNVAIRTLAIGRDGKGEMGIGSGIVYDSEPAAEYQECLLKGRFLSGNTAGYSKPQFDLLETLRWEEGQGYHLREEHLQRLENSAGFFGYPFDRAAIENQLDQLSLEGTQRARLLLHKDGSSSLTATPIPLQDPRQEITFVISDKKVDSSDIFFYHKTTKRDFYEDELAARQKDSGCDEVLFLNERGELTEGSRTNVFIEIGGRLYTPALDCGVLNGTLRTRLLKENFKELSEKKLSIEDLEKAEAIYFGNSVRNLMPAKLIKRPECPV